MTVWIVRSHGNIDTFITEASAREAFRTAGPLGWAQGVVELVRADGDSEEVVEQYDPGPDRDAAKGESDA